MLSAAPCTWPWVRDPLLDKVSARFLLRHSAAQCFVLQLLLGESGAFRGRLAMPSHGLCSWTRGGQHWLCPIASYRQLRELNKNTEQPLARPQVTENDAGAYVSDEESYLSVFDLLLKVLLCQKLHMFVACNSSFLHCMFLHVCPGTRTDCRNDCRLACSRPPSFGLTRELDSKYSYRC